MEILNINLYCSFSLSDEPRAFQPQREQDIADKCVEVPPCDQKARYRTLNGACNNDNFPMWGMAGTALVRLISANYFDGKSDFSVGDSIGNSVLKTRLYILICFFFFFQLTTRLNPKYEQYLIFNLK